MVPSELAKHWTLDPDVVFLNHGSFGACPRVVQAAQAELRREMEREPVRFFVRALPDRLDTARARVSALVGARPEDLVFVRNATIGVNTALRSFPLGPGDEVVVTDHGYNACNNAAERWAAERGARVVQARLPFPCAGPDEVVDAVLAAVTPMTRLAILDAVTSPTALVLPLARLVPALKGRGVETIVDGAHAIGMLDLDLDALGAAYFTSNAHKWLCAPKGAAILHVREDMQDTLRPLATSHGMNRSVPGRPRLWTELDWTGTDDPTPPLTLPTCLDFLESVAPGGLAEVRAQNHALVVEGRQRLLDRLGLEPAAPEAMLGSLATIVVPGTPLASSTAIDFADPLHEDLYARGIQVPVFPQLGRRMLRISAQLYNAPEDYDALADALADLIH